MPYFSGQRFRVLTFGGVALLVASCGASTDVGNRSSVGGAATGGSSSIGGGATTGGTSSGNSAATGSTPGTGGTSGLPNCGDNRGSWGGQVCAPALPMGSDYSGSAVVTSIGVSSDLTAACSAQRGLTLTIADGSNLVVGFSLGSAGAPTLESLQGKTVQAIVVPHVYMGYRGNDEFTLRDASGLVLSVYWDLGGGWPIPKTFDDVGISVSPGTATCTDTCGAAVRKLLFAGTTSVELAVGEQGTFQAGSATYTAYAIGCAETGKSCSDAYAYSSWAIFRSDL